MPLKKMFFNFLRSLLSLLHIWKEYKIMYVHQDALWFNLYILISFWFVGLSITVIYCQLNGEQTSFELYSFDERDLCIWKLYTDCLQCSYLLSKTIFVLMGWRKTTLIVYCSLNPGGRARGMRPEIK